MPTKKNKKILIYFFLFLLVGTFNNQNLRNLNFGKINNINVSGLEDEYNNQLRDKLNFLKNDNLFMLKKSTVSKQINNNGLVDEYSVFKNYPSTIKILANQTVFLAKVKKDNIIQLMGSNGKFIKTSEIDYKLPFIFGDFKTKNFFDLKNVINEVNFDYSNIKNFYSFKSGRWDIETYDGLLIKLPKNELKRSFENLIIFLSMNSDKQIKKVDLRQKNQIIINGN